MPFKASTSCRSIVCCPRCFVGVRFANLIYIAGSAPGGRVTYLCVAKEKSPKERRPAFARNQRLTGVLVPVIAFANRLDPRVREDDNLNAAIIAIVLHGSPRSRG